MEQKLKVGILRCVQEWLDRDLSLCLENHPWFEVVTVAASPRSAGKTYEEAVGGTMENADTPMPEAVKNTCGNERKRSRKSSF